MDRDNNAYDNDGIKLFTTSEYVKESQIKTFFSKCFAEVKNQSANGSTAAGPSTIQNEAIGLNQDELDEIAVDQRVINTAEVRATMMAALNQNNDHDDGSNDVHPLEMNQMDLCLLACDYKSKRSQPRAKLFLQDYQTDQVLALLEALDIQPPENPSYRKMAKAIFKYVQGKCPNECTKFA